MTLPPFRPGRSQGASAGLPGHGGRETLRFPLAGPLRVALVDADFHPEAHWKCFTADDLRGLADYAPEALAAPLSSALSLADRKLRGLLDLPSLKFAIVVFSSLDPSDSGLLVPHHRDLLWTAFGLPVYEQLRGWDGRVIARECEVHDGLHFDANAVPFEVAGAEIALAQCDCGLETPRLRGFTTATRARAAAA